MTPENTRSGLTFDGLGIAPSIREVLKKLRYETPTPIQHKSIPIAIDGKDLIGIAQTGTGKTLAFGIPMVQQLLAQNGRGLIVLPTRELALQVDEVIQKIGRSLGITTAVLIGGASMGPQLSSLRRNPRVIIATPGRLIDHMEQRTIRLDSVSILVLDEADRMLDMGFLPQMKRILSAVSRERQTMLFSATLSREIMAVASQYMKLPVSIEMAPPGTTADRVTQEIFIVRRESKAPLLEKLLEQHRGPTLVFSRTKHGAKKIARSVRDAGHTAAEIHSNRSLSQRREALGGFKTGKYRVLVATDIASRGIDVTGIETVINYDLPSQSSDYVHRIGRTGRAGQAGHAISFALPEERRDIRDIERLTKKSLQISATPDLPNVPHRPESMYREERDNRYRGNPRHSRPRTFSARPRHHPRRPRSR